MRLTTIGTGTASPHAHRVSAGHLVDSGAVHLLLDCGSGVLHRFAQLGVDWMGITHVALTHFDADHTSDLASLIVAWRYGTLPARTAPVEIIGPAGIGAKLEQIAAALWPNMLTPGYPVIVRELPAGESVQLADGVILSARKVPHTEESVAYSLVGDGRRIVYTGDTGFDPTLAEWAHGCDVLLCECSLPASMAIPSHLTPEQCGEIARIAAPQRLVLTHFYPPVETVDVRAAVAASYAGEVILAHDGWTIEI